MHFQSGNKDVNAYIVYKVIEQQLKMFFNVLGAGGFAAEESVTAE